MFSETSLKADFKEVFSLFVDGFESFRGINPAILQFYAIFKNTDDIYVLGLPALMR